MPADFRINLAKDFTSSAEERSRFYHMMLIYLACCAVLLVLVAYLTSLNLTEYVQNKSEQRRLVASTAASGVDKAAFRDPQQTYTELNADSTQIGTLKKMLGQRVQLLPVVHNLFLDLPPDVALQSLSADKSKLSFGLVTPPVSDEAGDPVKKLRAAWESNEELMKRVVSIRPVNGERRMLGSRAVFYVQFECILK
jgi:hypothetical protein